MLARARPVCLVVAAALLTGCPAADRCGDGVLDEGEQCDDGNRCGGDGCSAWCSLDTSSGLSPGNGIRERWEGCDDGNLVNGDGCSSTATPEHCGNGTVEAGEECDDGNDVDDDGCSNACRLPGPGEGGGPAGEECDDGNDVLGDACADHRLARCGDGYVFVGVEDCDDGNTDDGDECPATCQRPPCGDGVVDGDEECDDGNRSDADACTNACRLARCGDLAVHEGVEECDGEPRCLPDCRWNVCGDGVRACSEPCDDGDVLDDGLCDSVCQLRCDAEHWPGFDLGSVAYAEGAAYCVVTSATPRSFDEASTACTALPGGALAGPALTFHAQRHAEQLDLPLVWIGATDRDVEGRFPEGGPLQRWAAGQPDDAGDGEDCVAVRGVFPGVCGPGLVNVPPRETWSDEVCELALAFVCAARVWP